MRAPVKFLSAALGSIVAAGAVALVFFYSSDSMVELRAFEQKFAVVELGDPERKVLALLGPPDAKETTFRIGQRPGYEAAYARATATPSVYYLVWARGVDVVFSVGIDAQGRVRAKEYGGT
jgi:hypothetical protein